MTSRTLNPLRLGLGAAVDERHGSGAFGPDRLTGVARNYTYDPTLEPHITAAPADRRGR